MCKNKPTNANKVFKGIADTRKSTMGWFDGSKLHMIVNDKEDILNFTIPQGNTNDRKPLKQERFFHKIFGKLFADKGYIDKKLVQLLFIDDVQLIPSIRNNMKNRLMTLSDKILLRKRAVIETVNDELKNIYHIEHPKHKRFGNLYTHLVSGSIVYSFLPQKAPIR